MVTTKVAGKTDTKASAGFPIVGLGASAGGLEAFEQFFRKVPRDSGMAFVLVPHLDPGHASILTEILQRSTAMPVVEAQDQMAVAPNRVYVIPPNRDMAIFHGALQLSVPEQPRGHRMPIDAFLRSLAEDQGEQGHRRHPLRHRHRRHPGAARRSSAPAAFRSCRTRPLRNTTACRRAPFRPATPPMSCRWKKCRRRC